MSLHNMTQTEILEMLKSHQNILIKFDNKLHQMPDVGIGTDLECEFIESLHDWADLDESVRNIFGFKGCIWGPDQKCNPESPVVCVDCADTGPVQVQLDPGAGNELPWDEFLEKSDNGDTK